MDWKIYFCKFYEINSSQEFFLYCKHFGVDGIGSRLSFPATGPPDLELILSPGEDANASPILTPSCPSRNPSGNPRGPVLCSKNESLEYRSNINNYILYSRNIFICIFDVMSLNLIPLPIF